MTMTDHSTVHALGGYVLPFRDIDRTHVALVGGKGAHLGALSRIGGIRVPSGFCVTTHAFRRVVEGVPSIDDLLEQLDRSTRPESADRRTIARCCEAIRHALERAAVPHDVTEAIVGALAPADPRAAYAVRSSATAEDLPAASFAGQHDTYLNIVGQSAILEHIRRCWASLFTERAVAYRVRNGVDHRHVHMAVVVQQMVFPRAAGVLFTADPVTSNRKVASVEAVFGLGEALVSGLTNPDAYQVRAEEVVAKAIAVTRSATHARPDGGTRAQALDATQREVAVLTDAQVVRLAQLGRRIEAHLGHPQDIEWCLDGDDFAVVQSRPITTLFPIPERGDDANHVYVSVGHQQMMTDPLKPLGLSLFQLTAARPMFEAGGRLFVDVTEALASPGSRAAVLDALGKLDPLIGDALHIILERGDFVTLQPEPPKGAGGGDAPRVDAPSPLPIDAAIVADLIARSEASVAATRRDIRATSGAALLEFILTDIQELKRNLTDPRSHQVYMTAMDASWWLNEKLEEWLGEKNVADTLTLSVSGNVTSQMGLALMAVADAIRPHPEVVSFLQGVDDDDFLDRLPGLPGGQRALDAIRGFLDEYGARCVGEIDITRPRWRERPSGLLPVILGNVKNFEPGEGERRFEQGRHEARAKEVDVLARLRALPDGDAKADETKQMIDRVRTFIGYREYPKFAIIRRYDVYKQALSEEAARLVRAGVLRAIDDVHFLTFQELHELVRTGRVVDDELLRRRKEAFVSHRALTPPRVLTSDGEVVAGAYRRDDVPAGAMVGVPVSSGTIEGRARVILDLAQADLEPGDILVTAFTDPSWSPVFVAIAGLVTEIGGVMTHGAVIAREYGLPAVVGIEHATVRIRDGQRIRVNGTEGYVEIVPPT